MNKVRERARLLKAFRKTGDEDYKRAAEALQIPLLDHLKQLDLYSVRRRGETAGKEARPRLYRMHRMIAAGATIYAAARQEVTEHGRGAHASDDAAIDYLRSKYAEHSEDIAANVALAERIAKSNRQFERSVLQLNRMAQAYLPPAWLLKIHQPKAPPWPKGLGALIRMVRHPLLSWRNTRPKNAEKRSNDMSASI